MFFFFCLNPGLPLWVTLIGEYHDMVKNLCDRFDSISTIWTKLLQGALGRFWSKFDFFFNEKWSLGGVYTPPNILTLVPQNLPQKGRGGGLKMGSWGSNKKNWWKMILRKGSIRPPNILTLGAQEPPQKGGSWGLNFHFSSEKWSSGWDILTLGA